MTISSWPVILAGLLGVLAPHLTDLLTKSRAPKQLKSFVNLCITTLIGTLVSLTTVTHDDWKKTLAAIGTAWVMSLATHYADPLGTVNSVQNSTAGFGLGHSLHSRRKKVGRYAGVDVYESEGPAASAKSPGMAERPRQSKIRKPRDQ